MSAAGGRYGLRFDEPITLRPFPLFNGIQAPTIVRTDLTIGATVNLDGRLFAFITIPRGCAGRRLPFATKLSLVGGATITAARSARCA